MFGSAFCIPLKLTQSVPPPSRNLDFDVSERERDESESKRRRYWSDSEVEDEGNTLLQTIRPDI